MPVDFIPTEINVLQTRYSSFKANSSKISLIEEKYKLNDKLDGRPGLSPLEESVYASLDVVINDNEYKLKQPILDGIYFNVRNELFNPEPSDTMRSTLKLIREAKKIYSVSDEEIKKVYISAYYDHLKETNRNATQLINDLQNSSIKGERYVEAIAECWYNPSDINRANILKLAKALVPNSGIFPIATFNALQGLVEKPLNDGKLYSALTQVQKNWNNGLPVDSITLVSAK